MPKEYSCVKRTKKAFETALTELAKEYPFNKITVKIPGQSDLVVVILDVQPEGIKKSEAFRPPMGFDSTWIVTDLR